MPGHYVSTLDVVHVKDVHDTGVEDVNVIDGGHVLDVHDMGAEDAWIGICVCNAVQNVYDVVIVLYKLPGLNTSRFTTLTLINKAWKSNIILTLI